VDILLTRSISLIPMTGLGFSDQAINFYLPILALQSVFIHGNLDYPLDALRKVIAIPRFHLGTTLLTLTIWTGISV
jgi:sterol desaturase/sphingolipid hydroxylase (fatty acid hydroxylase superfamily)